MNRDKYRIYIYICIALIFLSTQFQLYVDAVLVGVRSKLTTCAKNGKNEKDTWSG